jgi:DNA-binding transcriptional ArsR family regulator
MVRIYFASVHDPRAKRVCSELGVRNYLLSFALKEQAFDQNSDVLENPECRVMVDSGAFSVWSTDRKIDVRRYADFAHKLMARAKCDLTFVNLDVIPGRKNAPPNSYERDISAEQSFRNWEYLRAQGVPAMGVFHQYERFYWLDELKKHSDYIGISPANDVSVEKRDLWLSQVFQWIEFSVKTHGFGVTAGPLLLKYPFFSVDSTTWMGAVRYGSYVSMNWTKFGVNQTWSREMHENPSKITKDGVPSSRTADYRFRAGVRDFLVFEKFLSNHWSRRDPTGNTQMPSSSENKPRRKPRLDREQRRKQRIAKLTSGSVQVNREDRFAIRRAMSRLRRTDWILYAIYEHLSDLSCLTEGSPHQRAQLHFWELAEDFEVSPTTIRRRVRTLEDMGLVKVERAKSDCSPNVFTLLNPRHEVSLLKLPRPRRRTTSLPNPREFRTRGD